MSADVFVDFRDAAFTYDGEAFVFRHLNLTVPQGQFLCLLGGNGSGKSTLAKHINALLLPDEGEVDVFGCDTRDAEQTYFIRSNAGLVFQNPDDQLVASLIENDVAFGPENLGIPPEEIRQRVDEALKAVGMYDFRLNAPYKLSGGQKQRIAIAGIIAMQPDCIVLDEPTAMLDPRGRTEVLETIHRLNEEKGITIVLITHYMDEAVQAGRVIVMDGGHVLLSGEPREVFSQVELLKKHQLDVPQATELTYRLQGMGFPMPCTLTTEECVEAIAAYLPPVETASQKK